MIKVGETVEHISHEGSFYVVDSINEDGTYNVTSLSHPSFSFQSQPASLFKAVEVEDEIVEDDEYYDDELTKNEEIALLLMAQTYSERMEFADMIRYYVSAIDTNNIDQIANSLSVMAEDILNG